MTHLNCVGDECSKKKNNERAGEKRERMRVAGMFLTEGEKENKRRGDRDRTTCVEEKDKKKRNETYG